MQLQMCKAPNCTTGVQCLRVRQQWCLCAHGSKAFPSPPPPCLPSLCNGTCVLVSSAWTAALPSTSAPLVGPLTPCLALTILHHHPSHCPLLWLGLLTASYNTLAILWIPPILLVARLLDSRLYASPSLTAFAPCAGLTLESLLPHFGSQHNFWIFFLLWYQYSPSQEQVSVLWCP